MDLVVVDDVDELAGTAATLLAAEARRSVYQRGRFALAVSGGATPAGMFSALASRDLPWRDVELFQVDERVAPPGDPDRNLRDLLERLVDRVPLPVGQLHAMPVEEDDLGAAARRYAALLSRRAPDGLDLVHLGLGDDGHTASWPPGDPVVSSSEDVAVVGPYRGRLRMTLTPRVVNRARRVLWLVSGAGKAHALARLLAGDPTLPASRVATETATVVADRAAADT